MNGTVSDKVRHFFHVVSNIRTIVWIVDNEPELQPVGEFYSFIKECGAIALRLERRLTAIAFDKPE